MKGRKTFFFEKKNQKTLVHLVHALPLRVSQRPKVFWCFFSKKNCFLPFLLVVPPAALAQPALRADAIAKAFHDFCLKPAQNLESMAQAAVALGAAKKDDKIIPTGQNRSLHEEIWLMRTGGVVGQLAAMEGDAASGPDRALGCSVTTTDTDGLALSQSLTMGAGLGAPDRRIPADAQSGASVMWARKFDGHDGRIVLAYGAPGSSMVSIHLILPNIPR
jgi:hypothetical protein